MLTSKAVIRVELEHEPGQWVEARKPSMYIIESAGQSDHSLTALLEQCITKWSYKEPVTPENIRDLDTETCLAVSRALQVVPEGERKND